MPERIAALAHELADAIPASPTALPSSSREHPHPTYIGFAQLPFVALVIITTGLVVSGVATAARPSVLLALALAVVLTVLAFVLPWQRIGRNWLVLLAIGDIVVVAIDNDALYAVLPAVSLLIVFPVLWLCYAFRWPLLLLGIAGSFAVTLLPFARKGELPGMNQLAAVIFLPVASSLLAVAVHIAALQLREQQQRVRAIAAELRTSLAAVVDRDVTTRAVLDTVDAGIALYDAEGTLLLSNALASTGLTIAGSASTTQLADEPQVFEKDRTTPMPPADQIIARAARGELVTRRTFWIGTGAEQRAVVATSQYARRPSGELIGTVVATHDVTQLEEAIRSRDEFLTTVSHELKTPLTTIIGYLDVLEDNPALAEAGVDVELDAIQRNSRRLLKLIAALLLSAQNTVSVDRRPFDVARLVTNAVNEVQGTANAASVRLVAHAEENTVAEIDADRIASVLTALIANAITFTEAGGEVSVTASNEGDTAVIRVRDTGVGMTAGELEHIFDRFYRAPSARANVVPGSGLGLTAAKVAVAAHRGTITATSIPGTGTIMEVRLPLRSIDVGEDSADVEAAQV